MLTYPSEPRPIILLSSQLLLTYFMFPRPATVLVMLLCKLRLLIYPSVPRPAVITVAVVLLNCLCKMSTLLVFMYTNVEKELSVEGKKETIGPPNVDIESKTPLHVVPPRPSVIILLPAGINPPVLGSKAYTRRSTILSDILSLFLDKRLYFSRESFAQSDDARRRFITTRRQRKARCFPYR